MLLPLLLAALFAAPVTTGKSTTPIIPALPAAGGSCEVCIHAFTNAYAGKPACAASDSSCGQVLQALKAAGKDAKAWGAAGCIKITGEGGLLVKPCPPAGMCAALPKADGHPFCPKLGGFEHPKGGPAISKLAATGSGKLTGEWARFLWIEMAELKEVKALIDRCQTGSQIECLAIATAACRGQGYVTGQVDEVSQQRQIICTR